MNTRRVVSIALLGFLLVACARPTVVPQNGKQYALEHRPKELFVYVEYHWHGGKFDDATKLEDAFVKWADKENIFVYAMGRYPTSKLWQLGFVASRKPDATEFQGHKISAMTLPEGEWAVLRTVDNTDHLFWYWKKFANWLRKDGYPVDKPVFEIYPTILDTPLKNSASRGDIRYLLPEKKTS